MRSVIYRETGPSSVLRTSPLSLMGWSSHSRCASAMRRFGSSALKSML